MKIDYLRLAKELTCSNDINELIAAAKKLEEYDVSDFSGNIETFNVVDFAKNLKIQHPTYGSIPLKLYDYQKSTLKSIEENQFVLIHSARQMGLTTMLCVTALWEAISKSNQLILMCSSKYIQATEMLERIYHFHDILSENPIQIFNGVKNVKNFYDLLLSNITTTTRNKNEVSFSNGSRILCRAVSPHVSRGLTVDVLIVDDAGYISHSISRDFWSSVSPVISYNNGKIVLGSNGGTASGLFYDLWSNCTFTKIELPYALHPDRNEQWARTCKSQISVEKFAEEYECKFREPPTAI